MRRRKADDEINRNLASFLFLDISFLHSRYHQNNRGKYKSKLEEKKKIRKHPRKLLSRSLVRLL